MVDEPLVAAEISDQLGTSGRKRQAGMEMSLMDRQRRVDGSAAAMNDDCARESHVDQPSPEEVERHLVGNPRRLRRDRAQHAKIVCRGPGQELRDNSFSARRTRAVPLRSALVPEMQFAARHDLGMHGDDLLDKSCAGSRHADDQHRRRIAAAEFVCQRDEFACAAGN